MDLIIGAGISGLSYANFIENDFFIVEKESDQEGIAKQLKGMDLFGIIPDIFFIFSTLS